MKGNAANLAVAVVNNKMNCDIMEVTNVERSYGAQLRNFIKSKISCSEDAKDIYQEVIVKIINKSNSLRNDESLKSWIFAIARNQVIDYYRSRKKLQELNIATLENPLETIEGKSYGEMEGCLHGLINLLPEDYKNLIVESDIKGKCQKELSETTGINYVTLRSKVQRGRDRIRKMMFNACSIEKDAASGLLECLPKSEMNSISTMSACNCN